MESHKEHKGHAEHKEHAEAMHTHHIAVKSGNTNIKLLIMAIALGLLIIISGVQAVELVSLKNKLNTELTTLAANSKSTVPTSGTLKDNLKNLPSMVGGC